MDGRPLSLLLALAAASAAASPAFTNLTEAAAARQASVDYANNVLRVEAVDQTEWNAENPKNVLDRLPANMPFQLTVGPKPEDRQIAEAALETARTSMPVEVRAYFEKLKSLAPVLQWLVRRAKPGVTNETTYLSAATHRAVWRAEDFDLSAIARLSSSMTSNSLPILANLRSLYEDYKQAPISRAVPLVDYSDPRPEVTYETPFGISVVLRAPERKRKFRFRASGWPIWDSNVNFKWIVSPRWASVGAIQGRRREMAPEWGSGEIVLDWTSLRGRMDVLVFARYGQGSYGPPSVISFYAVPNERRTYDKTGLLQKIEYVKSSCVVPSLFQNKPWRDEIMRNEIGQLIGFTRYRTGMIRGELFSATGDAVVETYANELPKIVNKVRYFTPPDDPMLLDYEILSEEVHCPKQALTTRTRGEFPTEKAMRPHQTKYLLDK